MWEKTNHFLSYKTSDFLIITTTKYLFSKTDTFDESKLTHLLKNPIPYISAEKTYCLSKLLEVIDIKDKKILLCEQIHGNKIILVNKVKNMETIKISQKKSYKYKIFPCVDGIITTEKDHAIVVFTADCIPLFIYSIDKSVFGLVHVGRIGLENNIIINLMELLVKKFNKKILRFVIGPHICEKCYVIDGKNYSLSKLLVKHLLLYGISKSQIALCKFCTCHQQFFFSYRRNKTAYRLISLITPKE